MSVISNENNLNSLKDIYHKTNKIAVFAGAGTSKILGIPEWDELLEKMNIEFNCKLEIKQSIDSIGYPKTASKLYELINDPNKYLDFLSRQFIPIKGRYFSIHQTLFNLFKIILTTNFDSIFRSAHEGINLTLASRKKEQEKLLIQWLPDFKIEELLNSKRSLVYLHANTKDNIYVFKQDEYECHYPSNYEKPNPSDLEDFLRKLFLEFTLVFIGFSFNDNNFVEFYKKVILKEYLERKKNYEQTYNKQYPKNKPPEHYVIISESELTETINKSEIANTILTNKLLFESLFSKSDGEKLTFSRNAEEIIKNKLNGKETNSLLLKLKKCLENKKRLDIFNELKIKTITFNKDDYNEIENILLKIRPVKLAKIQDAKYASY